jgi:murein L,D-transpeptidase YafK
VLTGEKSHKFCPTETTKIVGKDGSKLMLHGDKVNGQKQKTKHSEELLPRTAGNIRKFYALA